MSVNLLPEDFEKKLLNAIEKSKTSKNMFETIMSGLTGIVKIFFDTITMINKNHGEGKKR